MRWKAQSILSAGADADAHPPGPGQEGVVATDFVAGRLTVQVTFLAGRFLIGPRTVTHRRIEEASRARIYCNHGPEAQREESPTWHFALEGSHESTSLALKLITDGVQMYKNFVEGRCRGLTIRRLHKVFAKYTKRSALPGREEDL